MRSTRAVNASPTQNSASLPAQGGQADDDGGDLLKGQGHRRSARRAVTAHGCLAISDPQQTRHFFAQGQEFYRSRQIHGVRARDIVTDVEVPGIWVGRLVLENLDGAGSPVGREHNAYQVVTAPDGTRLIVVTTPLDAYNPDQQSGVTPDRAVSASRCACGHSNADSLR